MKNRLRACLLLSLVLSATACRGGGDPLSTDTATESLPVSGDDSAIVITATEHPAPVENRSAYTLEDGWTVLGQGVGYHPGRVVSVHDPDAFTWDGHGYWYLDKNFDTDAVSAMVRDAVCSLSGEEDIRRAFDLLFAEFNLRVNGEAKPYEKGQKIAIKTNMNVTGTSENSANSAKGYYPAPVTLRALLTLLTEYGVAAEDITVYDASRTFPTYLMEYCAEGALSGVQFVYLDLGGTNDAVADLDRPVVWSFDIASDNMQEYNGYPTYNTTYYPTCVTEADYMINLSCLRGHNLAGFTASGKNHFGTVMPGYTEADGSVSFPESYRTNPPSWSGIHKYVSARPFYMEPPELWDCPTRPYGTYNVLVDLLSNANGGGKTVLYLCDGLASTNHQGDTLGNEDMWYSFGAEAGEKEWPNTLLISQDPVALDSVALDYILAEQEIAAENGFYDWEGSLPAEHTADNYLIEAALAYNPPSGTRYTDGRGNPVSSLGAHEHWNNPDEKLYTGNTTPGVGIEHIIVEN